MLDPNHNAHGNYYLVEGDFTGSWRHVLKDLVMAGRGSRGKRASGSSPDKDSPHSSPATTTPTI